LFEKRKNETKKKRERERERDGRYRRITDSRLGSGWHRDKKVEKKMFSKITPDEGKFIKGHHAPNEDAEGKGKEERRYHSPSK